MKETWKDIRDYEGIYQISNLGRIKSLSRKTKRKNNSYRIIKEKILKPEVVHTGYLMINLSKNSKTKKKFIHRLVAQAFLKEYNEKLQVNHIDGNKQYNIWTNLEMVTPSENVKHAFKIGLINEHGNNYGHFGKEHHNAHKIYQIDIKTNEVINIFYGCYEAQRKTGIDKCNINSCCNGKQKTAGGYKWLYKEQFENNCFRIGD